MNGSGHSPLFHISKRSALPWYLSWAIRLAAIVLALIVCALVTTLLTGVSPLGVYATIIQGSFGTVRKFWVLLQELAILLCVSLAVTPAFKMRFWNIGGEGQVLIGATATAAVMINFAGKLPTGLLFAAMICASVLAGMIWGVIPALFKAGWNTNETLFTLMMNYVATQIVSFCIVFWENPVGSNSVGIINSSSKAGWLPPLFGLTYGWNLVIVVAITAFIYVYLRYSKQGYEIAYVGQSVNTARYAGINVKTVIIRTMAISGALCGLTGFILVSGSGHTISTTLAGGRGFTAIVVAWLSKLNTFTMVIVSFLLTFMEKGAIQIASQFNLNENASEIITGIILFFVLGCEFFINYRVEFRHRRKED